MIGTSYVRAWLAEAKRRDATHAIIVRDLRAFDPNDRSRALHEHYPVYVLPDMDVRRQEAHLRSSGMQQVLSIYALHLDIEAQLDERRPFHREGVGEAPRLHSRMSALDGSPITCATCERSTQALHMGCCDSPSCDACAPDHLCREKRTVLIAALRERLEKACAKAATTKLEGDLLAVSALSDMLATLVPAHQEHGVAYRLQAVSCALGAFRMNLAIELAAKYLAEEIPPQLADELGALASTARDFLSPPTEGEAAPMLILMPHHLTEQFDTTWHRVQAAVKEYQDEVSHMQRNTDHPVYHLDRQRQLLQEVGGLADSLKVAANALSSGLGMAKRSADKKP